MVVVRAPVSKQAERRVVRHMEVVSEGMHLGVAGHLGGDSQLEPFGFCEATKGTAARVVGTLERGGGSG